MMMEIEQGNAQWVGAATASSYRSLTHAPSVERAERTRSRAEEADGFKEENAMEEQCGRPGCREFGGVRFRGTLFCNTACLTPALRTALYAERQEARRGEVVSGIALQGRALLGSILVDQGAITEQQLASALCSQQDAGTGRLGSWLRQQAGLSEVELASALSIQSRCPVFRVGNFQAVEMASYLPRPLLECCGVVPLRLSGSPQRLALCFEDHVDATLAAAVGRMHDGMAVDAGLLTATDYWRAARELFAVPFAPAEQMEANSIEEALRLIVRFTTGAAARSLRVVAVHNRFWVRVLAPDPGHAKWSHQDLLCTLRTAAQ